MSETATGRLLTSRIFRYLYENLEAIFIATWLVSLVILIIVTLKIKLPTDKDWNSEVQIVYEKMMNREGLTSKDIKQVKEVMVQEEAARRAKLVQKAADKKKNKNQPTKAINLQQGNKLKLNKTLLKTKYDKKVAKNLCGDPTQACKTANKSGKAVCGQLKCCVWAYDKSKKKDKKYKGECVPGSVDDDGPTATAPGQKWDYYYYLNKKYNKN
tara:strand:- start:578 stop:1216 length:639 start_codon:yes stop_codon:yes gene_type:complete